MLTPVERVLILKSADLLSDVGPRRLLGLANVAREVEIVKGDTIYDETDPADALYMVVEGRVRLSTGGQTMSEVGPGEAFGTWSLVDDSARGQRAECMEDGVTLALNRDDFYDVAAGDLMLLQEVVRALAKRLRALVAERPAEARVEGEGIEKPEAMTKAEAETAATPPEAEPASPPGTALKAAALGQPLPPADPSSTLRELRPPDEGSEPITPPAPPKAK